MVPETARARARRPSGGPQEEPGGADGLPAFKPAPAPPAGQDRIIREYEHYGLEPVYSGEGGPVVSISMLITLGWKLKVVGANQFELVPPVRK